VQFTTLPFSEERIFAKLQEIEKVAAPA